MVMSAVSSVSTPGVLVTVMPRALAAATSMWSTPAPKLAISFSCGPAAAISAGVDPVGDGGHQHVGARPRPPPAPRRPSAASSRLSSVSNSSRIRVSTASGSLRVTTTFGLRTAMGGFWNRRSERRDAGASRGL